MSPSIPAPRILLLVAAELEYRALWPKGHPEQAECCIAGVGRSGDPAALAAIASSDAELVINVGLAGGLVQQTVVGDVCLVRQWSERPSSATCTEQHLDAVRGALAANSLRASSAIGVTVDAPVGDPRRRSELAATGAQLVDMESGRWAAAAGNHGKAFLALRVISDTADNRLALPRHELLTIDGKVHWRRWLGAPRQPGVGLREGLRRLRQAQHDWRTSMGRMRSVGRALESWLRR